MSTELIARNPDLKRLRDEGYDISIVADHLVMRDVPYVNSSKELCLGTLVSTLEMAGHSTARPSQHVVMFSGEHPCDSNGVEIAAIKHSVTNEIVGEIQLHHSFSNKPRNGYENYHAKMTRYATIISAPATALDKRATARRFRPVATSEEESAFKYLDTASSRAGIGAVSDKLKLRKVAIIGLGGTGSYVLDQVAKTPVGEIHLFDRDLFLNHNAFRCPGAASLSDLERKLSKVAYLTEKYSEMHRGIIPHEVFVVNENTAELEEMDFVFVCIDRNEPKKVIFEALRGFGIPFIDAGMGLTLEEGSLRGQVRTTTILPSVADHAERRVSFVDGNQDAAYDQNIQIADLNALNAIMAVIKWKKLFGFYHDQDREHNSVYVLGGNWLRNEDKTCA